MKTTFCCFLLILTGCTKTVDGIRNTHSQVGRFKIVTGDNWEGSERKPVLFKIDTVTGETWVFDKTNPHVSGSWRHTFTYANFDPSSPEPIPTTPISKQ